MPGPRILIADDSKTIRTQVRRVLDANGFDVVEAHDGKEALDLAKQNPPDAMVLDINMPALDGFGVCLELRKQGLPFSAIPIVFLTSSQSQALEILGDEVGAYLKKPVDEHELLQAVRNFVGTEAVV